MKVLVLDNSRNHQNVLQETEEPEREEDLCGDEQLLIASRG